MTLIWWTELWNKHFNHVYSLVLICCIFVEFSHTLSRSRCDWSFSRKTYVTPYTVIQNWTKSLSWLVFLFHFDAIFFFGRLIFSRQKSWLKFSTTKLSVVQILFPKEKFGFWEKSNQPTPHVCLKKFLRVPRVQTIKRKLDCWNTSSFPRFSTFRNL